MTGVFSVTRLFFSDGVIFQQRRFFIIPPIFHSRAVALLANGLTFFTGKSRYRPRRLRARMAAAALVWLERPSLRQA
jgi:hypothetical protein